MRELRMIQVKKDMERIEGLRFQAIEVAGVLQNCSCALQN
jgi:hypothetical protein